MTTTVTLLGIKFKAREVTVNVSELKTNLFVRERLDDDRVSMLLDLHLAGTPIDLIIINPDREIIDGRHRHMMYQIADIVEIKALEVDITDEEQLIAAAYQANLGGSLPPTRQDTEHTIAMLIKRDTTIKRIAEILSLPPQMVRTYAKEVKAKLERQAMQAALNDMAQNGMTVQEAADKNRVPVEKLKNAITPKRKKERKHQVSEVKRRLTALHRSLGIRESNIYKSLAERLEDGDLTAAQVNEILEHIAQLQRRSMRTHEDWAKRFGSRNGAGKPEAEA